MADLSVAEVITKRKAIAERKRLEDSDNSQRAADICEVTNHAERLLRFTPHFDNDPNYTAWGADDVPHEKYWLNFAREIAGICKTAKKIGFNWDYGGGDGDAESYVAEIFRLASAGKRKKPGELLRNVLWHDGALAGDKEFCNQCEELIRIKFPRRIVASIVGTAQSESQEPATGVDPSDIDKLEWSKPRSPHFWRTKVFVDGKGYVMSTSTWGRKIKAGEIRKHPTSTTRTVRIAMEDLPNGYTE